MSIFVNLTPWRLAYGHLGTIDRQRHAVLDPTPFGSIMPGMSNDNEYRKSADTAGGADPAAYS